MRRKRAPKYEANKKMIALRLTRETIEMIRKLSSLHNLSQADIVEGWARTIGVSNG